MLILTLSSKSFFSSEVSSIVLPGDSFGTCRLVLLGDVGTLSYYSFLGDWVVGFLIGDFSYREVYLTGDYFGDLSLEEENMLLLRFLEFDPGLVGDLVSSSSFLKKFS